MDLSPESSFGSWPSYSSKNGTQSVNSGVESESISPPSEAANGDMTSTHPAASSAVSPAAAETQAVPNLTTESKMHLNDENVNAERHVNTSPPNTTNVPTQHQTLSLSQTEKEYPKKKQSKAIATNTTLASVKAPEQKSLNVLVYDIATLLELSKGPSVTPVELEHCDEDIKENLFKDYLHRDHTRLRGLSNTSTVASESMEVEEQIVFMSQAQRSQRKPVRQPFGPPQSSLAQQNEGFARFLREHTSPPHHRVTAGGRIVPNSPLSPPPMFRLETIDSVVRQDQNHTSAAQTQDVSCSEMTSSCNATRAEQPNSTSTGFASSKQQGYAAPSGTTMKTSESSALGSNGQRQASIGQPLPKNDGRVLQIPSGAVPTMALPEGGLIINHRGAMYRATLNQANGDTDLVPLQVLCHAPAIQQPVPSYQPANTYFTGSLGFQPMTMLPSSSMVAPSMPLANSTNGAHVSQHHRMQAQVQIQYLQNQYDSLNLQLEGLDRHVALYRHLLSPMVNASMVSQRMQLVQQLDSVRVRKDQLQRSISMPSQNPGFPQAVHMPQGSQAAFEQSGRQNLQRAAGVHPYNPMTNVRNHTMGVAAPATLQVPHARPVHEMYSSSKPPNKTPTTQNGLKSSNYLSPDAPAFVPNTSATAFNKGGKTQEQCDEKILSKAATHQVTHTATPKLACQAQEQLPKVAQEDVEYVEYYCYNDGLVPKQFCSTVEEFQEVIRRVREQARMYGCAGGQSKDPEHDAEEDIRWAMSDKDAIPLPTAVPDHITNPRPWKWADSPFNIRSDLEAYYADFSRFDKEIHPSLRKRTNFPWGPVDDDDDIAVRFLSRVNSWDSLPRSPPAGLAPFDRSTWGNLPSDINAEPAFGPKLAWGEVPQAKYNGGAPPDVFDAVPNLYNLRIGVHSPGQGSIDSWDSPVRPSFWANANNHQDEYVDDGWNTPPRSEFTATTSYEAWAQRDPRPHQSKAPHDAAKNNHQFSKVSGQVKGQSEELKVGHTYAEANTVPYKDASKLQTSQPLYPASVREDSNRKPHQAYVEDAVDSPTLKGTYWEVVMKRTSRFANMENPWYKDNDKDEKNKDDDDASSLDSWRTRGAARNAALAKMVPENLRDQGTMNRPLSTNVLPGRAFNPSEVKAVRVPSPARNAEAKPYYLNMMKDPRYGVTTGDPAPASDGVDRRSRKFRKPAKKENQNVLPQGNTAGRGEVKNKRGGPFNVASNVGKRQTHQVHKAPSSIAAPVYQAHGYLPQYDGAANSLNWGNSTVGPHRRPPSRALLGGGVSIAGPPTSRVEHFPTGHHDAGPHSFRSLREEMARHQPFNPPNWQA